jgi:hypothetical protein
LINYVQFSQTKRRANSSALAQPAAGIAIFAALKASEHFFYIKAFK